MKTDDNGPLNNVSISGFCGRAFRHFAGAVVLGSALLAAAGQAFGAERDAAVLRSDAAYFSVYSYHCAPPFRNHTAGGEPDGMEVAVVESRFRVDFDGDCRSFYLAEIAPRVSGGQFELILVKL